MSPRNRTCALVGLLSATPQLGGCCRTPADPTDPAKSGPARAAERWLGALQEGDDTRAWTSMAPIARMDRTLAEFQDRVAAAPALREHSSVAWKRVHDLGGPGGKDEAWGRRCLRRLVRNVEVEGELIGTGGERRTIRMVAYSVGKDWAWKSVELDGEPLLRPRPPLRNPEHIAELPGVAPALPSPEAKPKTPIPPPEVSPEGSWIIGPYRVRLPALEGAWVARYDAKFGLDLAFGEGGALVPDRSFLRIVSRCEGDCTHEKLEPRITGELPERIRDRMDARYETVHWLEESAKIAEGQWRFRLRAEDASGETVAEWSEIATLAPAPAQRWLACSVELARPELERADALLGLCEALEWSFVGEAPGEILPPFAPRFELGGKRLQISTPEGFHFASYDTVHGILTFQGQENILDSFTIRTGCAGSCSAEHLAKNVERDMIKVLERIEEAGQRVEIEVPLEETAAGRYRSRLRVRGDGGLDSTRSVLTVLPPGADRFVRCQLQLEPGMRPRLEALEVLCAEALAAF